MDLIEPLDGGGAGAGSLRNGVELLELMTSCFFTELDILGRWLSSFLCGEIGGDRKYSEDSTVIVNNYWPSNVCYVSTKPS